VLCEHIEFSGGGMAYDNVDEFIRHFYEFYDRRKKAKTMGLKGYDYVKRYYSWDVVMEKIKTQLKTMVNSKK
jgi:glycosyltransferase involved in cell wall biosynthesis